MHVMKCSVVAKVAFLLNFFANVINAADVIDAQIGISTQNLIAGPSDVQTQNTLLSVTANIPPLDPLLGSISGSVSLDTGNDNFSDAVLAVGSALATTITDSLGNYIFFGLPAGLYQVNQTNVESGRLDVKDSDGENPNIIFINLSSGQNSTGNDFVDEPCRQIIVDVKEDIDNDGIGDNPFSVLFGEG